MQRSFIVSSGSSGIGKAILESLSFRALHGESVLNIDVHAKDALDVRDYDGVRSAIRRAVVPHGMHYFIGSAGVVFLTDSKGQPADFVSMDIERLQMMIDSNLKGMVHTVHALLNEVFAVGGSANLVLISSISAFHSGGPNMAVYDATKAAITAFAQRLVPYASRGVRINVIQPGSVRTNIGGWSADYQPCPAGQSIVRTGQDHDARRLGKELHLEQIVRVSEFLLFEDHGLNGAVITADGGLTLAGRGGY
jgi:NAD(P)-dependent dehydrogenase (short-subunit alcohol dehydrogenase family)